MKIAAILTVFALAITAPLAAKAPPPSPAASARAWALPERELMIPVEGGRVWVGVNGDLKVKAAPVVFVHGGPGATHSYFGGLTALADTRATIVYDQLDSGLSDHPNDPANWRLERFVEELEAIRKTLGIERWHVVGHSWGSAVALAYAAAHPDHVVSTVLAGTFISTQNWLLGTSLLIRDLPPQVQQDIAACEGPQPPVAAVCDAANDAFMAVYNGRADTPPRSADNLLYRQKTGGKGFNPALYNAMWGPTEFSSTGTLKDMNLVPLLAKLDGSRTLFMVGQYDEAHFDIVRDYVRLTPKAELALVPGGSHSFLTERPDETEGLLRGWLARKDPE